ncbi:HAMP domain-containing protein [Euhalothece natronophila Z-M001]|uniref:histidine kinase n=1 Tax=Euhalothece natronophila Z-M001 TaxID=522448 RepID=A0A5B8NKS4_9CHRO|nr:cache domain-containing protein [Euhalothece natronophila]QDZ38915.1 HAMP domain-containing protein [Euhalothece natronophila Z-M001]
MKLLRKSLLFQLAGSFYILSLITLSVVAVTAYNRARAHLKNSVFERLDVAVSLKDHELEQWFDNQRRDAILLANLPETKEGIEAVTSNSEGDESEVLNDLFQEVVTLKPDIDEVSILTTGGIVLLSSDPSREGRYLGLGNTTTYFEPDETNVIPTIYQSSHAEKPRVTLATPILDSDNQRQGALATSLNLDAVDQLIRERTGLGETGETYLVNRGTGENRFISGVDSSNDLSRDTTSSQGINKALNGESGRGMYENYEGVPVIGIYQWVDHSGVALIAEISQEEAFRPARTLAREIIYIGFGVATLMLILIVLLARQLAKPILAMTTTATKIENGEFDLNALEGIKFRLDELGDLARVFENMANKIHAREHQLKQEITELRIEIDQQKKEEEVKEIVETDFFQDLENKAQSLRKRKHSKNSPNS